MRTNPALRLASLALLLHGPSAAAQFTFEPAGTLVAGSGTGRVDLVVYAPGMRFPIESAPAYPNSQVWGVGGLYGPSGSQCATANYSYPWRDNYCETRSWTMPLCPAGTGHQGQDIRPGTCVNDFHWAVATVDGTITNVGSYSVYLTGADGTRYDYLHMRSVQVAVGDTVVRGERLGRVSDAFGTSSTTIHLHFNLRKVVSGYGSVYVPPYTSLVQAYQSLLGTPGCTATAEVCNGADDDCDGTVDDGVANACGACGAVPPEICDGRDNDCDGTVDDESVCETEELTLQPSAYDPDGTTDVDGDGRSDACVRSPAGFVCYRATVEGFASSAFLAESLSDDAGFVDPANYATLRVGDLDGDGRADVCGRTDAGVVCQRSDGTGFGASFAGPPLDDATLGFAAVSRYSTVRMKDFDGDGRDDLCARTRDDFRCYPSTGDGFGAPVVGPTWSDANGFTSPRYYGSIRMGDVTGDGRADVCVRGAVGIVCYLTGANGTFADRVVGPAWSDTAGYGVLSRWSTIRLVDVDGDGRQDVCARSADDLRCHLSTGAAFEPDPRIVAPLSDAAGYADHDHYSTLRTGDVDGDGAHELCIRGPEAVRCFAYAASGFVEFPGPALSDAAGWDDPAYYRTLRLGDVTGDGRDDLCIRGPEGLLCFPSTGRGFGAPRTLPELSDAAGYDEPTYHTTLRIAGRCTARGAEVCDGVVDEDCDGVVDEGCADAGAPRGDEGAGGCGCAVVGSLRDGGRGRAGAWASTLVGLGLGVGLRLRVAQRRRARRPRRPAST